MQRGFPPLEKRLNVRLDRCGDSSAPVKEDILAPVEEAVFPTVEEDSSAPVKENILVTEEGTSLAPMDEIPVSTPADAAAFAPTQQTPGNEEENIFAPEEEREEEEETPAPSEEFPSQEERVNALEEGNPSLSMDDTLPPFPAVSAVSPEPSTGSPAESGGRARYGAS